MASMKEIKQRIENVSSTENIIRAMDLVASTKLHRLRERLEGVRPIYRELKRVAAEIGREEKVKANVFYAERNVRSSLYIVITADQGFSGAYNANIASKALEHMEGKKEKILAVGAKGLEYFTQKKKNIIRKLIDLPDAHVYYGTESLAGWVQDLFLSEQVDEVFVAYTRFHNVLSYEPCVEKLLPVPTNGEPGGFSSRKYEPDLETFIENVIFLYLHMCLFAAFTEAHTSEQAARMVSMDAAQKNAEEMIEKLIHMYNRKRQAAITQELSEIIGGSNIINKGDPDDKEYR
ncbi:MAG: ATP synthase F1 subunit gamma [Limnochordia bacterium]|jgi:F-type H+-transporting ATPase subunit gamma